MIFCGEPSGNERIRVRVSFSLFRFVCRSLIPSSYRFMQVCLLANRIQIVYNYHAALTGVALSVAPHPSVRLSVRPSRVSDFLEIGKPQKLLIQWKHIAGQELLREHI